MPDDPFLPPLRSPELRAAMTSMVLEFEHGQLQTMTIVELSQRFMIKTRRLYDVINVFLALGCCARSGGDGFTWTSLKDSLPRLRELRQSRGIDDPSRNLTDLFPITECVGIANLTIALLLLFYAVRANHLDLRLAARVFSRGTTRFQSTLCKLYQICFVLSTAGIVARTTVSCEVRIMGQWLDYPAVPTELNENHAPLSLETLLNHKTPETQFAYKRRREMAEISRGNPVGRIGSARPLGRDPE
jgi:hypothetical protein